MNDKFPKLENAENTKQDKCQKKSISRHIRIKLQEIKDKRKILNEAKRKLLVYEEQRWELC